MLKEKLIVDLNEEGSRALAEIMRVTGLKRSQVIHSVLKEWEARVSVVRSAGNQGLEVLGLLSQSTPATAREALSMTEPGRTLVVTVESDPEAEEQLKEDRKKRKVDRVARKVELQKTVSAALPGCRPHSNHSGAMPIAGCSECAALAKGMK